MGLAALLKRGLFKTLYGGIFHKPSRRRMVFFFGDIFINYLKGCEEAGLEDELTAAGKEWMLLYFGIMVPTSLKRLPLSLLNIVLKKVWVSTGLLEDFSIEKTGNAGVIKTKNEVISKALGKNGFMAGAYVGILSSLYGKTELVETRQEGEYSIYEFKVTGNKGESIEGKSKNEYGRLNRPRDAKGLTLEDAFRKRILELKGNKIEFRRTPVYPVENTIFHIIGNRGMLLERVERISFEFFSRHVALETSKEKKLLLIRTLLESMGWGQVKVVLDRKSVIISILYPPHGFQKEEDNWKFLAHFILGYLFLINRNFKIYSLNYYATKSCLKISYVS